MSYQTHTAFVEPSDRTARLWRYMSLSQFLLVLDKKALFFPSVATLSELDPFEGEPALAKIHTARDQGKSALQKLRLTHDVFKHMMFFNCWHMNDGESDAMWKIYSKEKGGVAIQSTVCRLMNCFHETSGTVNMGLVKYVDHHTLMNSGEELLGLSDFMFKRIAFQHEKEVRLGICQADVRYEYFDELGFIKSDLDPKVTAAKILMSPLRKGVYVSVDVPVMVERVIVSPFSPVWHSDLVVSLTKKMGYTFDVVPSEISGCPPLSQD